jgi:hypothetical protein
MTGRRPQHGLTRRAALLGVLAAAASGCRPARPAGQPAVSPTAPAAETPAPAGLSTATAYVTVSGLGRSVRLDAARAHRILDDVWQILGDVPSVAPVADGPRQLAMLRINEQVLDVVVWKPQAFAVAAQRLPDVSGIMIPVTGPWRHRVLLIQTGSVAASPPLLDSAALAAVDDAVQRAIGPR